MKLEWFSKYVTRENLDHIQVDKTDSKLKLEDDNIKGLFVMSIFDKQTAD